MLEMRVLKASPFLRTAIFTLYPSLSYVNQAKEFVAVKFSRGYHHKHSYQQKSWATRQEYREAGWTGKRNM
jgi:hypothetical protein